MGFSRCISSSKSKREIVRAPARYFIASQAQMTNSSGGFSPARGPCCHTHINSKLWNSCGLLQLPSSLAGNESRAWHSHCQILHCSHWGRSWTNIPGPGEEVLKKLWWLDNLSHPTLIHTCPQAKRWPLTRWHHQKASGLQFPRWQGTQLNYAEILLVMRSALPI